MEDVDYTQGSDKSAFNSGLAKIERIHKIKLAIIRFRISDDLENWSDAVEALRDELDYKFDNKNDYGKTADDFEKKIENAIIMKSPGARKLLKLYGRWLGKREYEFGLGMPDQPTNEFSADEV